MKKLNTLFCRFAIVVAILFVQNAFAQLTVTVTYTGTAPTGGTLISGSPHASLAAAITQLNALTSVVGTTGITLTCSSGTSEVAPAAGFSINTLLGSSTCQIILDGNSKTIRAAAAPPIGQRYDAVIKIIGGDYITIKNFTITENSSNTTEGALAAQRMTEFGIALFAASATNGAQNNTIQNNTITLSSATTYRNAIGIFSTSASSSTNTAQAALSIAGTNSNNKFYSNIISGVAHGFYFVSPAQTATVFESGNDIGGISSATGNTITYGISNSTGDLGFTSYSGAVPAGVYLRNVVGNSVRYNTINAVSTLTLTNAGIFSANGTAPSGVTYTSTFSNNTITLAPSNAAATNTTGIDFGSGLSTATFACSNNTITITQTLTAAASGTITGIKANYTAATSTLSSNSITINQNFNPATGLTNSSDAIGILMPSGTTGTPTMTANGNTILINRATTVGSGTATMSGDITGISAGTATSTLTVGATGSGNANTITIKEASGGAGATTWSSAIVYLDVDAAHSTLNVVNNTFNTTGSTIRSTGVLIVISSGSTISALNNIKSNTATIDRIATGVSAVSFFNQGNSAITNPADTISSNAVTFTNLAHSGSTTIISQLGGAASPATLNKSICNNTINVSGTCTGQVTGIRFGKSNGANVRGNSITVSTAGDIRAIQTASGVGGTTANSISGNSFSLTSADTGPSTMIGIDLAQGDNISVFNNTISTMSYTVAHTSSPTLTGILSATGSNTIYSNTITGITSAVSTGGPDIRGIAITGGTTQDISRNKIYGLSTTATGNCGMYGIYVFGGTTINISNNLIGDITMPSGQNSNGSPLSGIFINGGTTANLYYNTVYIGNITSTGSPFYSAGIFADVTPTVTLRNNIAVNLATPVGSGVVAAAYYRQSATLTTYGSASNNNLFYAGTPSTSKLIYFDVSNSDQTLAAYKTRVGPTRDAASITALPSFLSTTGSNVNFLHIDGTAASGIESGAVAISGFTDDYDAAGIRTGYPLGGQTNGGGTAPDIGADEGDFQPPATPQVNLTINTATGTEAATTSITLTITAASAVTGDQTVDVALTGASSSDFSSVPTQLTILNGATTGTATFTLSNDASYECTETATFTISNPSSGITLGTTSQNLAITDNDFPTANLSINVTIGTEAAGTSITLTATSSANVITAQTFDVTLSGTNVTNSDFNVTFPRTITIANGASTGTTTFSINNDVAIEGTETATFTLAATSACVSNGTTLTQNLTITDNDFPSVNLSISPSSGTETAATSVTLTATASQAVSGSQTVSVALSGTNLTNGDFSGVTFPATITIANGATTGTLTFNINDDATINEGTETATFTISSPSAGIVLGSTVSQNLSITDNDVSVITTSGTLTAFTTVQGTPSTSQSFTVSGDNLTGNLSVTPPSGYEVSLSSGSGYTTGALSVAVSGGNVTGEPLTIYVRLTGTTQGSYSGNIVVSGGSATSVNVAVSGTVTGAPCSELFISEYHEAASGNEKYIEIYNPTSSAITLASTYSLVQYNNGSGTVSSTLVLSGSIPGYGTVYAAHSSSALVSGANASDASVMTFNGNDVIALRKSGVNIDVIGTIGSSANFAIDVDLRRLATVSAPVTTYNSAEWSSVAANNVTNIGSYTNNCTVANPTVNLSINTTTGSEAASTSITLTATASAAVTGNQTVQVTLSGTGVANADFSSVTFPVNITILNGQTTGTLTFTINNDVAVEGTETATFTIGSPSSGVSIGVTASQNLAITDDDNVTSSESVIDGTGGETATISSLTNGTITNSSQGAQVWQFRLYDGNGSSSDADTKPTVYQQFTIRQSPGNSVPVWNTTIDNVKFFLGASVTPISGSFLVSANTISFTPTTPISVADNGFEAITMRITLDAPLATGSDGLHFGFSINESDVTVDTDVLVSSQLGTFTETSNVSLNEITIIATLQFINAPTTVGLGDAFTITVSAIDANGNVDQNNTSLITLAQNTGTGTLTGTSSQNLVAGTYTWTGLSYNVEETFQIIASGGSFSAITANINVIDADYQAFDHFNRGDNFVVGIPSSETSTTYNEAGTGDGSRTRVESNKLVLTNCNSGSGSGGSNGMEEVIFNVENRYETILNNGNGPATWVFNISQDRTDPSGFGSNTYAAGVILGCDQLDMEAAGSDGYAVIIGNAGDPDPVKLVRFTNGLTTNANVTNVAVSSQTSDENYFSVKVTFDACTGLWSLYVRNDGASAFADPNSGSLGTAVTGTDQTHTGLDLKYFGAIWQHGVSCTETATFDNLYIPNTAAYVANTKTWNGSVSSNWNTAANWSPCPGVPTITDNVIIPVTGNNPIISATPSGLSKDLTINSGAQLTINSGQFLNAHGNVVNNGNINFGAGTLQLENTPIATVTVTGNINVGSFYSSNNATLSGVVTVTDQARSETGGTLNANGNLVLNNNAQLFHGAGTTVPCACEGTVNGNVVVKRNGTSSSSVYNYWSSPISSASLGLLGGSNYLYNPANGTAAFTDDNPGPDPGWAAASGSFAVGKGYAGKGPNPAVTFTGTANNGNLTAGVQYFTLVNGSTSPGVPYNLVGNPYPSNISATSFLTANNTKVTGAIYYWDDDNTGGTGYAANDYAIWNGTGSTGGGGRTPNGMIATAQGFFVQALSGATTVSFTNAMRASTATTFFKTEEDILPQRIWLRADNGLHTNQILVGYVEGATQDMDWFYDAQKLRGNPSVSFYSLLNDTTLLGIQGLAPLNGEEPSPVPLGLYAGADGQYSIYIDSIENFPATMPIPLKDADMGIVYDLRNGPYVFQTTQGEDNDRFVLFPDDVVTGEEELSNLHLNVYPNPNNGQFTLMLNSGIEQDIAVSLVDVTGKLVFSADKTISKGNNFIMLENNTAGIYMLNVNTRNGNYNKRVIIY